MEYKYKVGDIVEVEHWGSGFNASLMKKQYKIIKTGKYSDITNNKLGYQVQDLDGKLHINTGYNDFVGEKSFKLITSFELKPNYEIY